MSEVKKQKLSLLKIYLILSAVSLVIGVIVTLFTGGAGGSSSISSKDVIHYLGKSNHLIQSELGSDYQLRMLVGGYEWKYKDLTIGFHSSGVCNSVQTSSKSYKVGGCSINDSLKSIESAMKKMDGGFVVNHADIYYSFNFKYEGRTYELGCVTNDSQSVDMLVLSI